MEKKMLTTDEAADLLRCCRDTVYALFNKKCFKGTKVGGKRLWKRSELEKYLERQTRAAK